MKGGNMKHKITNLDLLEERNRDSFERKEMEVFLYTQEKLDRVREYLDDIKEHPEMKHGFDFYDMTREQKMEFMWIISFMN